MADPLIPVTALRLRHGHGETLLAADFAGQAAQDDQLRWWHNRAVHDPFGVVRGLGVRRENGTIVVEPGLAYDRHGRELILRTELRIALPADPQKYRLVLGYRAAAGPGGPVRLCWSPMARPLGADGVPLATGDGTAFAVPRSRPIAAPRIGHGVTQPGLSGWEFWREPLEGQDRLVGMQLRVDTSASGFTAVPCYFVQFTGGLWSPGAPGFLTVPLQHIAEPSRNSFLYRVLVPVFVATTDLTDEAAERIFVGFLQIIATTIFWTGIQQHADDPSTPTTRTGDR